MYYTEYANKLIFDCPEELQNLILNTLQEATDKADEFWRLSAEHYANGDEFLGDAYAQLYDNTINDVDYIIWMLGMFKIYPVYNWIGHRDTYFFPTYEDCLAQEDWIEQCKD